MKKLVALCLISGLLSSAVMNVQAFNEESQRDVLESKPGYELLKDENGKVYDLGGTEIIIRNWWSPEVPLEPQNAYEEARQEYLEWAMETYNFTIREVAIGDWGTVPVDFVEYVTTGGDDINYVFTLREDSVIKYALKQGLMYDLSTLSCLDFTETKFQRNKLHEQYSVGGRTYAMNGEYSEPRCGMFFNRTLLEEAGINPDAIYDMQKNGTWTWDAWTDMMDKVQKDIDGDGNIDIWGFDANYGVPLMAAIYSNDGEVVGMKNGKYTYELESPETMEAMEWFADCLTKYVLERPEFAQWDYYKEAFINGECAFMPDEAYCGGINGFLEKMEDDIGFVMFPKGPQASDYVNCWNNNIYVIPGCYNADRAWKIAFAYDIYTNDIPGYENYFDDSYYKDMVIDDRAKEETIPMMIKKGMITYHSVICDLELGSPFMWKFKKDMEEMPCDIVENIRDTYKACIDEANNNIKDVSVTSWQYRFVKQVMDLGIMNGKAKDKNDKVTFDPNNDLTRAEFVRALYNKESKPAGIQYTGKFTDVKEGEWYTDAILWAANNGLVNGKKPDYFDVHGKITREEIATILYKYAVMKGYDVTKEKDFTEYEDGETVSSWAVKFMKWALGNNIMKGQGTKIAPRARATRAESATMITNFMSTYEK